MNDTIFALSSGTPPAGIAVIRLSGPSAHRAAEALCGSLPPPRRLQLRRLLDGAGDVIDEALVARFDAPASATGEPMVEFHCHGARAVVAAVLARLAAIEGLREARPGEFTRRALSSGRIDLTEAEGLGELLSAETEWQRRAAIGSASGVLRHQIDAWRDRIVSLSARAEAAIDYVGEDETAVDVTDLSLELEAMREEWRQWLSRPRAEAFATGLTILLAGPPNSGKSSLFNALTESERAIVTPVPGTTRDLLEARLDLGGVAVTLVDSAGIRSSGDVVERIGIDRALAAQSSADIICWLGNASEAPPGESVVLVHAKDDIRSDEPPPGAIRTSVKSFDGVGDLVTRLTHFAQALLPPPETFTLNRRQSAILGDILDAPFLPTNDLLLIAEWARQALRRFDEMTGRSALDDVLDSLFQRFCLGK